MVVGRIAAIQFFTTTPDELGASIIDPDELQVNTDSIIPTANTAIPSDPIDNTRQSQIPDEFYGTTRILIPPHISQTALQQLTTLINEQENTDLSVLFQTSPDIQSYIQDLTTGNYDIALTTPNHISDHNLTHISLPLDPSMRSGIHPSAQQAARREDIFFVPFALDPYIAAVHKSIPGDISTRSELSRRIALYPEDDMTPYAYGTSDLDDKVLASGQHIIETYSDINHYLDIARTNNQKSDLSRLVQSNTVYDPTSLFRLALSNRSTDPLCKDDDMSCLDSREQFQTIV